jgi:uncharacterized UPF0160 family protein
MSTTLHTNGEPLTKRQKLDGPLIGTHNGTFHADEALAVYMLRLLPTYANSPLVRTREPSVLETCHTVVDVGAVHSDSQNRYDHHQKGFTATYPGRETKLSSAGLVYMYFGKAILARLTGLDESSKDIDVLWNHIYETFIEAIDANDNGIKVYDETLLDKAGIKKRFSDRGFTLASVVNRYNYAFPKALETDSKDETQAKEDERFERASQFMGEQFVMEVEDKADSWLPAYAPVRKAYAERYKWDESGRIMVFEDSHMPFASHLYDAEREEAAAKGIEEEGVQVWYVLFPEGPEEDSKWRVRAVTVEGTDFTNRKDLPSPWKGLRDEELSKVSGVEGCVFVHASGFIGGNKTMEGALEMARKAVAIQ